MNKGAKSVIYILLLTLIIAFGLTVPAWSEEQSEATSNVISTDSANLADNTVDDDSIGEISSPISTALQITPVNVRIALEAGKTVERSFKVTNNGPSPFTFRIYATPYNARGDEYDSEFTSQSQYTKIINWISFLDSNGENVDDPSYILNSDQSITIRYRISVPENVASGGQYACIFAEIQNDNEANEGIQTIPRAGLVVFGNVAGETKRLAKIGDIDISSVLFKGKISITANVENIGNIDFQSSVDVNVKSIFGKELYSDHLIYTVLPETTRKIYTEWNDTPFYGLFSLKTKVTALGTEVESERIILVMPPIMIAFTIVLASGIIISLMIYLKKKKAYSKQNDSEK